MKFFGIKLVIYAYRVAKKVSHYQIIKNVLNRIEVC